MRLAKPKEMLEEVNRSISLRVQLQLTLRQCVRRVLVVPRRLFSLSMTVLAAKGKCNENKCKLPSIRKPKNLLEWRIDDSPASCADNSEYVRLVPALGNAITSQEITFRCENGKIIYVRPGWCYNLLSIIIIIIIFCPVHPHVIIEEYSEKDEDFILQRCTVNGVNARPTWFFLDVAKRTWRQITSNRKTTYVVEGDNNDSLLHIPIKSNSVYGTYKCVLENVERNITVEPPRKSVSAPFIK